MGSWQVVVHLFSGVAHVTVLSDFRQHAAEQLEDLGDAAAAVQRCDEPIPLYTRHSREAKQDIHDSRIMGTGPR